MSWATGSRQGISSVSERLGASGSWNLARSGARVADLPGQARAAAAHRPAMVTVLIGANDACASDVGAMTAVADFRTSFDSALSYLHRTLPGTQVLVASIPDLQRLWSVGAVQPAGPRGVEAGPVPVDAGRPDLRQRGRPGPAHRGTGPGRGVQRGARTGLRAVRRCRYDGGAVFRYPFGTGDLSRWDWFHPNERGQGALARILAGVAQGAGTA